MMNVLPVTAEAIGEAVSILENGGVIAHATETCYGFACDVSNPEAVAKLFAIKKRSNEQPVSVLFSSLTEAKKYVQWNDEAERLAVEHLPGPLTLILSLKTQTPSSIWTSPIKKSPIPSSESPVPTLGIRISSSPLAQELVSRFGKPISTTSANIHGQANPYSAQDIIDQFKDQEFQPDLILDSGILPPTPPSTVIDLSSEKPETRRTGHIQA